jgi:hypothetical protein
MAVRNAQPKSRRRLFFLWLQWQGVTWIGTLLLLIVVYVLVQTSAFMVHIWFPDLFAFPWLDLEARSTAQLSIVATAIQSLLMLFCGIFVGDAQAFWLRRRLPSVQHWFWWTALGLPLGSTVMLLILLLGGIFSALMVVIIPFWVVLGPILGAIAGGAILGGLQWLSLRDRVPQAIQWLWVTMGSSVFAVISGGLVSGLVVGLPWWMASNSDTIWSPSFLILMLPVATAVSWFLYHGLTGIQMAYFLYDQDQILSDQTVKSDQRSD